MIAEGPALILCDRNRRCVNILEQLFAGARGVEVRHGDLLATEAEALICPGNGFGFLDSPLERELVQVLGPTLQPQLLEAIRARHGGELMVGEALVLCTGREQPTHLVYAPLYRIPEDLSRSYHVYYAFRGALRAAIGQCRDGGGGLRSLGSIALGAGSARVPPLRAARQMKAAYDAVLGKKGLSFPSLFAARKAHQELMR